MRFIDKSICFASMLSLFAMPTLAQLPWFLQRFRPIKNSLLGSGSIGSPSFISPLSSHSSISPTFGSQSLFSPFGSASSLSPTFGSFGSPLGAYSFGPSSLGLPTLVPSRLNLDYSLLGSSSHGHSLIGPSGHGSALLGASSFDTPSFGSPYSSTGLLSSPSFSSSGLLSSPSFSSSGLLSSPSFSSSGLLSSSPNIGSSSFGVPKYASSGLGSHSLSDFNSFDGYGGIDQEDLEEDFDGFSGSHKPAYHSQSSYGNDYNFLKRSDNK